ncbi:MAG TPA: serine hydroxymethyltransferase, partial [Candidatus Omnitrophica bacterium]|nr:serine hydroxymethyltransferase [Candidatus Omnitrophota bacterium]
ASTPEFKLYQERILTNAKVLAHALQRLGYRLISGGTDTHLILVDLRPQKLTGKEAEEILGRVNICVNKNSIPYDPLPPDITSGIRLGTPALTTQNMGRGEIELIASLIHRALKFRTDENRLDSIRKEVKDLCKKFPPY